MSRKDYVYLAGPMEDVTAEQAKGWRDEVAESLDLYDISVLDPTRRASFHEGKLDMNLARRIFKMDLQDVANSTVVLADVRRSAGRGTGTSMELMFAHTKNKIIILLADQDDPLHPFIESMYTEKHFTLEDAIEACTNYFD